MSHKNLTEGCLVEATLNNGMRFSGTYEKGEFVLGPFRVKPDDVANYRVVRVVEHVG